MPSQAQGQATTKKRRRTSEVDEMRQALDPNKEIRKRHADSWDLTLGTDFSGMETPVIALENMGFKVKRRFRCECNHSARKLLQFMWPSDDGSEPIFDFKDITKRQPTDAPHVDCYVAGVPCQPWSTEGVQKGLGDPRGQLWKNTLRYVQERRPKTVIFENIKGLLDTKFADILKTIIDTLEASGYRTWHTLLNTYDHGLPQHRERLYIVAVRKDAIVKRGDARFTWPEPLQQCLSLKTLLARFDDGRCGGPGLPPAEMDKGRPRRLVKAALEKISKKQPEFDLTVSTLVVDIGCSADRINYMTDCFPTITAKRGSQCGWWIVNGGYQVALPHLFLLQGMSIEKFPYEKAKVSAARMGHMCGNAMSCNVLERLLPRVLAMVGIRPSTPRPDPWPAVAARCMSAAGS